MFSSDAVPAARPYYNDYCKKRFVRVRRSRFIIRVHTVVVYTENDIKNVRGEDYYY